jgi:hypothetical protein
LRCAFALLSILFSYHPLPVAHQGIQAYTLIGFVSSN